jgi:predicted dehydrogenase
MVGHGLDIGPYTRLATVFGDRIRGVPSAPGPEPATFADGVADMAVLDAARASAAAGGRWVDVAAS